MKQILRISTIAFLVSTVWSQTTGKISGTVTGDDGTPLVGANVLVLGTGSGASSNADGEYQIINVPAGSYVLKATYIGYTSQEVSGVRVISGLSTPVDLSLSTSSIEGDVVQVVAEKPLIQKDETSSVNVVTGDQLENMPIRTLDGVLATMPGVVVQNGDVHIRGGRDNEVAYYLNGASTTNLANRENLVYVPQEAIEELQVQVGGYDAEVSGANSGVVKRSLKTGTDSFSGSFSLQTDGSGAGEAAVLGDGFSYGHQTVLASVGGPIMPGLKFFAALEQSKEEDPYVKVANKFEFLQQKDEQPSNSAYPDMFDLTWRDGVTPGSDDEFTNLTGTVTYDAGPLRATLGMVNNFSTNNYGGGIMSQLRWGGATIGAANADGVFLDSTGSLLSPYDVPGRHAYEEAGSNLMTGELTYALSSNTVLRASVSSYSEERETMDNWFGSDWKRWSDSTEVANYLAFPAVNDSTPAWSPFQSRFTQKSSYMVNGMSFSRPGTRPADYSKSAYSKTGFSASIQHVVGAHDIKAGMSYNQHTVREYSANPNVMKFSLEDSVALADYGHNGYGDFNNIPAYQWRTYIDGYGYDHEGNEIDDRKFYISSVPGVANSDTTYLDGAKTPTEMGFYVQDKMEFDDLVVNVGIRVDQLNPSETAPENANELYFYNVSKYVDPTTWKEVETYTEIQPRIGISFPFTDRTNVYGYYGRFSQLVDLNSMYFTAFDYRTQMNTGGNFYITPVGFGLEPVRTTQYEIGFKQAISNDVALKATWFYKNQKGLIQADRVTDYLGQLDAAYNYVRNGDFATTKGLELSLALRRTNGLAVDMNYTVSQAEGTGSGRSSYLASLDRGSEPPLMVNPLDFNQAHSGSVNLDYRLSGTNSLLDGLGSNLLFTFNSGHAYTYVYRPIGGQVSAFDAGVDYMYDTRSRKALEPIGSSTTPWVYNLDLKLDKRFDIGGYGLTVFARVNNLLDRRNALNVYQATGSATDDGFYGNDVYSASFIEQYGQDPDGDGVTDYEEMYRAINIDNDESFRTTVGDRLISAPRQVFLGLSVDF